MSAASSKTLAPKTIALIGNPNTGKTTLFNILTGLSQQVGNYPGVTVERKSGSIIALGGQSAITGRPGTSMVTTAKTGVLGLMRAVAAEMAPYNIRANMVNPGSTDTSRGNPEWYPEFQQGVERGSSEHLKEIPMGRQATVEDIANACLFFASDESGYITGDSLNVMGGRYIN